MSEIKVLACDVCERFGVELLVEQYRVRYPDGDSHTVHLCPEHAAPLVKLRDSLAESKPARKAVRRKRGGHIVPIE